MSNYTMRELIIGARAPGGGRYHAELMDLFLAHVRNATKRYPAAYFELCVRDDSSLESLRDQVLTTCAGKRIARSPFAGRTTFDMVMQSALPDSEANGFIFYYPYSLLREQLWKNYAANLRCEPSLQHIRDAWAAHIAELRVVAEPSERRVARQPLWRPRPGASLSPWLQSAFAACGGEGTASQLFNRCARIEAEVEPIASDPEIVMEQVEVRQRVLRWWTSLTEVQRGVVEAVLDGRSADEIMERHPLLRSRPGVTRAVAVIVEGLVTLLEEVAGKEPLATLQPMELLRLVRDVLMVVVRKERRDGGRTVVSSDVVDAGEDWAGAWDAWQELCVPTLDFIWVPGRSALLGMAQLARDASPELTLAQAEWDECRYGDDDTFDGRPLTTGIARARM